MEVKNPSGKIIDKMTLIKKNNKYQKKTAGRKYVTGSKKLTKVQTKRADLLKKSKTAQAGATKAKAAAKKWAAANGMKLVKK